MQRSANWLVILTTTLLLFGGLEVAALLDGAPFDDSELRELAGNPLALFLGVGVPVVTLEALFWTVAFVEFGAKLARSPWLGAAGGVLGYGLAFHWSGGIFAVLVSSWIALVLNCSYVILRKRSRNVAILSTVLHKIAFIIYAAIGIYTYGA